jgi:hypothetical protein
MRIVLICAVLIAVTLLATRSVRHRRRRKSLHYDDGYWFWTGFDGHEYRSDIRPDEAGGDWKGESWLAGIGLGSGDGDGWDIGDSSDTGGDSDGDSGGD